MGHLHRACGSGVTRRMMQQGYIQLLGELAYHHTFIAGPGIHEQLPRHPVHGVTRPTVGHGPDQGLDHTQSVFATGLLVVQVQATAEVIRNNVPDDALPGDLQQLSGLVFVVIALVYELHVPVFQAV